MEVGIEMIENGSDGDSREMKFMLEHTGLEGKFLASRKTEKNIFFRLCPGLLCNIRTCDFALKDVLHSLKTYEQSF